MSSVWIVESFGRGGGPKDGQFAQVITADRDHARQVEDAMRKDGGKDAIVKVHKLEVTP